MGFENISSLALLCLVIVGIQASPAEDYWQSVWPNTPIPNALWDILQPSSQGNLPIKEAEKKQYWTVFYEYDLHPGKKISLGHKQYDVHPLGAWLWGFQSSDETERNPEAQTKGKATAKERETLKHYCEKPAAIGEYRYCATSLESMMDFAISKLGKDIKVISSSFAENQDQYVVEEVRKIGDSMVMCHRLNLHMVAYYCHQVNATTVYMVPLVAPDGTQSKALAFCHHDVRGVDPHLLHDILKVKPGTVPCHFVGNKAIAWVPNSLKNEQNQPCVI